jgi:outer membrane biosynthesis protein TonB
MVKLPVVICCAALMFVASLSRIDSQTKESPLRVGPTTGRPILPPRRTKTVVPAYPRDADSGLIGLDVTVDPNGHVDGVKVLYGVRGATDAAVAAVAQWEYEPTLLNGEPVWLIMAIRVPSPWSE